MYTFIRTLMEKKEEPKLVFVETDPNEPFPDDTINYIEKEINKLCKDLKQDWDSAVSVVNAAFDNFGVPQPRAYQKNRWEQYTKLLGYAVKNLYQARGLKANWSKRF